MKNYKNNKVTKIKLLNLLIFPRETQSDSLKKSIRNFISITKKKERIRQSSMINLGKISRLKVAYSE